MMKRGVEDRDLWHPGAQHRARGGDAAKVVRIVQGREVDQILDRAPHLVVDAHRLTESFTAVHDAVADGLDLRDPRDRGTRLLAREPADQVLDGRRVVAELDSGLHTRPAGRIQLDDRFAADPLDLATGQSAIRRRRDRCRVGVDELKLECRRTDVQNENVHAAVTCRCETPCR
jgi:hypothetical protein